MGKIEKREEFIFNFIKDYIEKNGYSPSCQDIATKCGLKSTSTAHGYLVRLEKRGLIYRDPMKPRTIVIKQDESVFEQQIIVPILGKVAAGLPILATENLEGYISMPYSTVMSENVFALKVKGDSMINAGIMDGDLIFARQQNWAQSGEIVVAMIDGEATLKRYIPGKNSVKLQAENPNYAPIYSSQVNILGKLVALVRKY